MNYNKSIRLKLNSLLALGAIFLVTLACSLPDIVLETPPPEPREQQVTLPAVDVTQANIPTLTPAVAGGGNQPVPTSPGTGAGIAPGLDQEILIRLHDQLTPGVVNINVIAESGGAVGAGAGSGFILDENGYIVTNQHVVDGAIAISVVYYNGLEAEAEVVGEDSYSDLAVLRVSGYPEGVHPLPLGDSNTVRAGEWVVAIGNPFGQSSSMSLGIVSAVGRSIPSGVAQFSIPEAIQTDAAINPGNSGGPLLNLRGEVIGVNAQIATGGGIAANAGVGFAIPANIVRRVVPVLIEQGAYQWPYLGVEGIPVSLIVQQANNLETQNGAYINGVVPGGPAEQAGMQGSTGTRQVNSFEVPVGGDVVIEADGVAITDFDDLLAQIATHSPGDVIQLVVLRDGERINIEATLAPRP